jgi:poly [ADP-ribose] polymerase
LLLCEVALGCSNLLADADYNAGTDLPKGCHSVKGCGRVAPQEENCSQLEDGTIVPMGPGKETSKRLTLNYNEFIVYDTKQIRVRYLAKIKFNFKH